jgi:predicted Zn-dependent peptidase
MYKKDTLKNGLSVITSGMPHMESVSIGIWIGVGGRYEGKRSSGMSHLIEHMLFKGTARRSANTLKESIEGVGGSFNGFTGEEVTCYLVKLPAAHMALGLDVLSDMVLNPKLDPVELEKEKYVICEEIKMYHDQPAHRVFEILAEGMWPRHALGRPIAGYIETVKSFKREDLVDFKNRYYRPANICVVACGRIGKKERYLASLKDTFFAHPAREAFSYESIKKTNKGRGINVFYKDTKQTHLAFGFHGIRRDHELKYALALLNIILGGNMSSRLFERLREKKALCYEISSSVKRYEETSAFVIHAGVDNNNLVEAASEITHELKALNKNFVTLDELTRAKEYVKGQMLLGLEDTAMRMLWLGERITTEGKAPSVKKVLKGIEKVTIYDIKKLANIIFDKANMNFATVGPARASVRGKLRKALRL